MLHSPDAMIDDDEEFQDLLKQLHLPPEIKDKLLACGYDCTLTFGLAFSSMQSLDQNLHRLLPAGETDHSSPTCTRLRALWTRCHNLHTSPSIPAAQPFPPTPARPATITSNPASSWQHPSSALLIWKS